MSKEEFIQYLKEGTEDSEIKKEVLQYFVDNYPVWAEQMVPLMNTIIPTGFKTYTKIEGYSVKNDKFAMKNLEVNFRKLQDRLEEIIKFNEDDKE